MAKLEGNGESRDPLGHALRGCPIHKVEIILPAYMVFMMIRDNICKVPQET